MKRFNLTLRRKILIAFSLIIILLVVMGGVANSQARQVNALLRDNYVHGTVNMRLIGDIINQALRVRERLVLVTTFTNQSEQLRQFNAMNDEAAKMDELLDQYKASAISAAHVHMFDLLDQFDEAWSQALATSEEVAQKALAGQFEEAQLDLSGSAEQELNHAIDLLLLIQDIEDNDALNRFAAGQEADRRGVFIHLGLTGTAVGIGVLLAYWMAQSIGSRIKDLAATANQISIGNFKQRVEVGSEDEIGELAVAFNKMTARLQEVMDSLERRVIARTRDLSLAAEVGNRISTVRDLDQLLAESVELIRSEFELYYVQIYLAGANGRYLKLSAGTGEAGEALLRRGHQLAIGPGSINGAAAARHEAMVVPDTTTSPIFRPNPLLPETRSEMAVPMVAGDRLVGVLNLQNNRSNSLTGDNLGAFQTVASQLAIALENARLFVETVETQEAMETQARFLAREGWDIFLDAVHRQEWFGYAYDADQVQPLVEAENVEAEAAGMETPILVSGESIGSIRVNADEERPLTPEDTDLVKAVARQISERVESLRLLAEADRYRDEAEAAARRLVREGWETFQETTNGTSQGYVFDHNQVQPVAEGMPPISLKQELTVQGQKIGELGLAGIDSHDEETAELVQAVAEQLSAHLENLRLSKQTEEALAKTERQARRRELLNRLSEDLTRTQELEKIYQIVTNSALEMVNGDRISLTLLSDDMKNMTVLAARGDVENIPINTPLPIGGLVMDVLISHSAVLRNDPAGIAPGRVIQSSVVAPISVGGQIVGTLNIGSKQLNFFNEEDRDLIVQMANILSSVVENRQLFSQMQERAEELAIINQVAETVSQHMEPGMLLKAVYDQIQRVMSIDAYHVGIVDEESNMLTYPVMYEDGKWLDAPPVAMNPNSNSYKVIKTGKPVILNLTEADKEALTQAGTTIGDTSKPMTSSSVFLPLLLGNRVAGVIAVHSYQENAYDQADLALLTGIANHMAVALDNARLFAESQEHAEELAILNEMGRTLTTKLDLNSILVDTHRYVTQLLDAKDMYVALYDEETDEVDIKIFGEGEDVVHSALRRRAGNGITEVVLRSRKPLLIKDNIEEAAARYGFDLIGRAADSWLGVPMTVGDKILGIVAVQDFDKSFAFNEHQQDLLMALSSQVAIAIENVRLFDQEQSRAQRERLLREITEQIRRSSDVDTIMRTAVQEVGRALGRRTYVYLGDDESPVA